MWDLQGRMVLRPEQEQAAFAQKVGTSLKKELAYQKWGWPIIDLESGEQSRKCPLSIVQRGGYTDPRI